MNTTDRSHAIGFTFHNKDDEPVFTVSDKGEGQTMFLTITNHSGESVSFGKSPLQLLFRPGLLVGTGPYEVTSPKEWVIDPKTLAILPGKGLGPGEAVHFGFKKLKGDVKGTAHSTRVELKYTDIQAGSQPPVSGKCEQALSIVYHLGRKHVPLHAGIVGPRTVLNTGVPNPANKIVVRLTNISASPLALAGSRVQFQFEADEQEGPWRDWALGYVDQVAAISRKPLNFQATSVRLSDGRQPIGFTLGDVTLQAGDFIDFEFSNFATSHPAGETNLTVSYEGIPGYWDGEMELTLVKAPLWFMTDNDLPNKPGAQTDPPTRVISGSAAGINILSHLQVAGAITPSASKNSTDATTGIIFPPDPGRGLHDTAWIRYYPRSGEACTLEIGISNDADDHIALMTDGGVGIGTNSPKGKLDVSGDVSLSGKHAFRSNDNWLRLNQDGQFSEGVHTRLLFAPGSLNVGGKGGWVNPGDGNARIAGSLDVGGRINVGQALLLLNSDIYFTRTDHNHSGFGNTAGYAAIENAQDHGALMILGRAGTDKGRMVKLWDYLEVNGGLKASSLQIGSTIIGETELARLKALLAGTLSFQLINSDLGERMYCFSAADGARRSVLTWGGSGNFLEARKGASIKNGNWQLRI